MPSMPHRKRHVTRSPLVAMVVTVCSCSARSCSESDGTEHKTVAAVKGPVTARIECELEKHGRKPGGVHSPPTESWTQARYRLHVEPDRTLLLGFVNGATACDAYDLRVDPSGQRVAYRSASKSWNIVSLGGGRRLLPCGNVGFVGTGVDWAKAPSLDECLDQVLPASTDADVLAELRERRGAKAVVARLVSTANAQLFDDGCHDARASGDPARGSDGSTYKGKGWVDAMVTLSPAERSDVRRSLRERLEESGPIDARALARIALWASIDEPSLSSTLSARVREVLTLPASPASDLAVGVFLYQLIQQEPDVAAELGCQIVQAEALRVGIGDAALLALAREPSTCPDLTERLVGHPTMKIACCSTEDPKVSVPCEEARVRRDVEAELARPLSKARESLACKLEKGMSYDGTASKAEAVSGRLLLAVLYAQKVPSSELTRLCRRR
jgi:hypothetical protein